jgi:hypothetical protein
MRRTLHDYATDPRRGLCPCCGRELHGKRHLFAGHEVAYCNKWVIGLNRRCCTHVYVLRDDEGGCYAVPITQAQYEHLLMFEAVHGHMPPPPAILKHLGLEAA